MFLILFCSVLLMIFASRGCSQLTSGPQPQPYSTPETCSAAEFYRSANLSCVRCGNNQLVVEDGLSCVCQPGFYQVVAVSGHQCQPCGNNMVTTQDGLFCLSCESTGFNPVSRSCSSCPSNTQIFVDNLPASQTGNGNRSCMDCPTGTWPDPTGTMCVECGIPDCRQCVVNGGVCFPPSFSPSPPSVLVFDYYSQHFSAALELCRTGRNESSCQLLANLCVLQLYSPGDPACREIMTLASDALPPLVYPLGGADEALERDDLVTRLVTSQDGTLPLTVAVFALNGSFIAIRDVTDDVILCHDRPSRSVSALSVGVQYVIECDLSVSDLLSISTDPFFYDLYLRDRNLESDRLYPLPVLIANYRDSFGQEVNRERDISQWQLVRRFYLAQSLTNSPLYARTMRISVRLNSNGRIFPPLVEVDYSPWTPSADAMETLPVSYSTEYVRPGYDFTVGLAVTVSLLAVVVGVFTGFRLNGYLRRSGRQCCDPHAFVYLIVELCGGVSTAIFILLTVASTFWLLFFKVQTSLFFALPVGSQELAFHILLGVGLLCRCVHVVYLVWQQCTVDIFFIDWERSRGVILTSNQQPDTAQPTTVTSPVSIWRTYFAANEWNEIQSIRKINPVLLLCLVLLFGQVVGLVMLAERDPSSHVTASEERYSAPHSSILRFSITSLHFIIIATIMRVFVFLVYERFFEHKIRQFVDLCSVSNISVFVMSHQLFGYYVHGRSVHGHADTDMKQMNINLQKEQENMCGHRGLELNSDLQTFEVALKPLIRNNYDRIISGLYEGQRSQGGVSDERLRAYEEMNRFLSTFLERSVQGMDYLIKDKLFVEKIFGTEFFENGNMSIFYRDPGFSFERVLFYGNEWTLFQLDVLVFVLVDLLSGSYVLATVITFLVFWLLTMVRSSLGQRNIGRKTLVDDRFLI